MPADLTQTPLLVQGLAPREGACVTVYLNRTPLDHELQELRTYLQAFRTERSVGKAPALAAPYGRT